MAGGHPCYALAHSNGGREFCSCQFPQPGFVIEKIDMRWRTGHEHVNDPFCASWKMKRRQSAEALDWISKNLRVEERCERKRTEPGGGAGEKSAAVQYFGDIAAEEPKFNVKASNAL